VAAIGNWCAGGSLVSDPYPRSDLGSRPFDLSARGRLCWLAAARRLRTDVKPEDAAGVARLRCIMMWRPRAARNRSNHRDTSTSLPDAICLQVCV
jgi:hypothetical protein